MAEPLGAVDLSKLPPSDPLPCDNNATWQVYVDSSLMGSQQFDKAGILKVDFSALEAKSSEFQFTEDNRNSLISAFTSPDNAFADGFSLGQDKFVTIKADARSVYGKKGKEGVIVCRATSCTFIAHHGENAQTTNAATVVENLVDYVNKHA